MTNTSVKKYPKYKDSGIPWIGEIPEEWKLIRLQFCLDEIKEQNDPIKSKQVLSLVKDKGVMLYEEKGNLGNVAKEDISEYKLAYPNNLILNSMNILIGSVGISKYFGCVSPVYYVFKETDQSDLRFINYIFTTKEFQKELRRYANGIMEIRLRVSAQDIIKRKIAFPPKKEQQKISDYLDEKCGTIDQVIETEEKIIEKLKEYKKSLITEVVTKGLDRAVPVKDSGIPWTGQIPLHWKRTRIKRALSTPITDGPHETPQLLDTGVPFLSAEAVKNNKLNFDLKRGYISKEEHLRFCKKCKPQINDIFMIKSGATTGNIAIVETEEEFSIWSPLALIRVDRKSMSHKYMFYYLQSAVFRRQVELFWSYGTQQNIGMEVLGNLYVAYPDNINEQKAIANYLDNKCAKIDKAISDKEQVIEKLTEYKKSLIYECVTGKRMVA